MPKNKKPHANTVALRDLVERYGLERVLFATGYKLGTLNLYLRDYGPVIPDVRLNLAKILLAQSY